MKYLIFIFLLTFLNMQLHAQDEVWQQIIEEKVPQNYNMSSALYQLGKFALYDEQKCWDKITKLNLLQNNVALTINIEISYKDTDHLMDSMVIKEIPFLNDLLFWRNLASVWIKPVDLIELARLLPSDYFIHVVFKKSNDNEGPGLTNSLTFNNGGKTGSGIKIAIIDSGFDSLSEAQAANAAPANPFTFSYFGSSVETANAHGTACLETVYDHAPDAQYYLYRAGTIATTGLAVADAISKGVNIISHSQSEYNTGWFDDTGPACAWAKMASDSGVIFFTSAGNRAEDHYKGTFKDNNNNSLHEWSGTDENNKVSIDTAVGIRLYLSWNTTLASNYDLLLIDSATGGIVASSTASSGFEVLSFTPANNNITGYIRIVHISGDQPEFEIFMDIGPSRLQYFVNSSSTTSPSNSTEKLVISVGAVSKNFYGNLSGANNIIANYSGQGPTNSGNLAPDLVGPTNTITIAYAGNFGGTSCSTPNVAGMAAAFWSAHPYLHPAAVVEIIFKMAEAYKDWGTSGSDFIYGKGGVYLYDYYSNTRFLSKSMNNILGISTYPYYTVTQAENATPLNGRVVILDGNYPGPHLLTKKLTWSSLVDAVLGN